VIQTQAQYENSTTLTLGRAKKVAPPSAQNKGKNAAEMRKRLVVGFMVLAYYVLPMYLCPLTLLVVNTHVSLMVSYEALAI